MPADYELSPSIQKAYDRLLQIRASKDLTLKPCPFVQDEIVGLDGQLAPFSFRYYQVQGVFHLMVLHRIVLGDGTGLGKCVTKDSLLVTDQGLVPIWELAPDGELVPDTFYPPRIPLQVWTGHEMSPIRRFYWNGATKTHRLRTRDGFTIEGSARHPVLSWEASGERLRPLPEIGVGSYICIDRSPAPFPEDEPPIPFHPTTLHPNCRDYEYPTHLSPELARLLGYVVAEAWTNGRYNTNISQHLDKNPEVHTDIRRLLSQLFGWAGDSGNRERDRLIAVSSVGIRQYLEKCGVTRATSRYKEVPWVILRGTQASVREFLRGLLDAEGCVLDSGGVEFTSASKALAKTTQLLLLRFGIVAALRPKRVAGFDHTYWRLSFFGEAAKTYLDEIGFVSGRKEGGLRDGLQGERNPNKDVVPLVGDLVAGVKSALLTVTTRTGANGARKGSGLKQFGESFQSTLKHVIHGRRNPTYNFLHKLLDIGLAHGLEDDPALLALREIVRRHYYYDPVVDVAESEAAVMDIEVDHPTHCFSANGMVHHNTIEALGGLSYLWATVEPANKVLVISPKSAIRQWAGEIERFTHNVRPIIAGADQRKGEKPVEARARSYREWADAPTGPDDPKVVLILNYAILVRDWDHGGFQPLKPNGRPDPKQPVVPGLLDGVTHEVSHDLVVIFDEAQAFKNIRTKTWEKARFLSDRAHRVIGLTATLLKNHLFEGYCIYKVIKPDLFGTQTKFRDDYCFYEMKRVKGNRKIPIIKGYKNLDHFRKTIDPFFLGRPKHVVSNELPTLVTREVLCELSASEDVKYSEALTGVLELGDGDVRDFEDTRALTSLIYCQQVANSLALLKYKEGQEIGAKSWDFDEMDWNTYKVGSMSAKEQALLDIVTGELDHEKIIIYTRFESLVGRLQKILEREKVQSVRITGKEDDATRRAAQEAFQKHDSGVQVIFITDAGSEAINLQAAAAMIFYDMPWSWGNYVQTLGRMIRIGSPHKGVIAFHLIAERPAKVKKARKTIDHYVLAGLRRKKNLIDRVIGEAAVGALKFDKQGTTLRSLVQAMQKGA